MASLEKRELSLEEVKKEIFFVGCELKKVIKPSGEINISKLAELTKIDTKNLTKYKKKLEVYINSLCIHIDTPLKPFYNSQSNFQEVIDGTYLGAKLNINSHFIKYYLPSPEEYSTDPEEREYYKSTVIPSGKYLFFSIRKYCDYEFLKDFLKTPQNIKTLFNLENCYYQIDINEPLLYIDDDIPW